MLDEELKLQELIERDRETRKDITWLVDMGMEAKEAVSLTVARRYEPSVKCVCCGNRRGDK